MSTFTYSSGLLSTIKTVNNRTTTFAYTGTDLTQITNPDGGVQTFAYDTNHRLTGDTFANTQDSWTYSNDALASLRKGSSTSPTPG